MDCYDKEPNLNHDIDRLYTIVKKNHDQEVDYICYKDRDA